MKSTTRLATVLLAVLPAAAQDLSPAAQRTARLIGILPRLEELRATPYKNSIDALRMRQDILEAVMAASFNVDSAIAEIQDEQTQIQAARDYLEAQRDRRTSTTNLAAIILSTGIGVVATGLQFGPSNAGNAIGVASGAAATAVSIVGIRQQRGGKQALPPAHIAVILGRRGKQILDQVIKLAVALGHHRVKLAVARGKTSQQAHAYVIRVEPGKIEKQISQGLQRPGQIAAVGRARDLLVERPLVGLDQGREQPLLAAEVVVQGRFGHPGRVDNLLHAHTVVAAGGEKFECAGEDQRAVIHRNIIPFGIPAVKQTLGLIFLNKGGEAFDKTGNAAKMGKVHPGGMERRSGKEI